MESVKRDIGALLIAFLLGTIGNIAVSSLYFVYGLIRESKTLQASEIWTPIISWAVFFLFVGILYRWFLMLPPSQSALETKSPQLGRQASTIKRERVGFLFCDIVMFGSISEQIVEELQSEQPASGICPHCGKSLDSTSKQEIAPESTTTTETIPSSDIMNHDHQPV